MDCFIRLNYLYCINSTFLFNSNTNVIYAIVPYIHPNLIDINRCLVNQVEFLRCPGLS